MASVIIKVKVLLATGGVSVPPLLAEVLHALSFRTSQALSLVCHAAKVAPVLLAVALATGGVSVPPLLAEVLHALSLRTSPALSRVCLAATLLTIIAVLVATLNKRVPLAVLLFRLVSCTSETLGIVCHAADLVLLAT